MGEDEKSGDLAAAPPPYLSHGSQELSELNAV